MANNHARFLLRWLGATALVGLSLGCSSQSAETKRQLETLNERLLILQNDRDRLVERVDALEAQQAKPQREMDDESAATATGTRPLLKVVRLEPATGGAGETSANAAKSPSNEAAVAPVEVAGGPSAGEPQVVLYGEGSTSGVRPSAEGVK